MLAIFSLCEPGYCENPQSGKHFLGNLGPLGQLSQSGGALAAHLFQDPKLKTVFGVELGCQGLHMLILRFARKTDFTILGQI